MSYFLGGSFAEACDCRLMCPCWTDDEPDEGHCTGLFAWNIGLGSTIDGVEVAGAKVVCLTSHTGKRRPEAPQESTVSVLFVDTRGIAGEAFALLTAAFSGRACGPLEDLATVNGTVITEYRAHIEIEERGQTCLVRASDVNGLETVRVDLRPARFDRQPPLAVLHTALHKELQVFPADEPVIAQHSGTLEVRASSLPGGQIEVTGRSGMRGEFRYVHP
ncbi:DUF1326 domain-containing protein [Pseudonocardia sp.]|jgi:hypothetical protein|uniref:DUF1326 domain-containing protein n=1 Tax=Pseudonocardia sp. TaxID=60912 RepID=UPI0031FC70FB